MLFVKNEIVQENRVFPIHRKYGNDPAVDRQGAGQFLPDLVGGIPGRSKRISVKTKGRCGDTIHVELAGKGKRHHQIDFSLHLVLFPGGEAAIIRGGGLEEQFRLQFPVGEGTPEEVSQRFDILVVDVPPVESVLVGHIHVFPIV